MRDQAPLFTEHDVSEADIAALRWRAIEAANTAEGISPLARRLLTALICMMDNKSRACFPSELRLAASLGVHVVSVKKAKAELHKAYFIHWTNPGGPRHQSHYIFNWEKLIRLSQEAKERGEAQVASRRANRASKGSQAATFGTPRNGSRMTTIEGAENAPIVAKSRPKVAVSLLQGSQMATPIVAAWLPEQPYEQPLRTALPEHAIPARPPAGAPSRPASVTDAPSLSTTAPAAPLAGKGALEGKAAPAKPKPPPCYYPALVREFTDEPETLAAIGKLMFDDQGAAAKAMVMKGRDVARAVILGGGR